MKAPKKDVKKPKESDCSLNVRNNDNKWVKVTISKVTFPDGREARLEKKCSMNNNKAAWIVS
jgi:hypothetical protein